MPAPVPPGFTRGPILFLGTPHSIAGEAQLLQRFWSEAGGYGSRILLLTSQADDPRLMRYQHQLQAWEVDTISALLIEQRAAAFAEEAQAQIDHATAILFLAQDARRLARLLGGTPLAQAIRRANARGKTIGALGAATGLLCQHMLCGEQAEDLQFYPGLGAVNRLTIIPSTVIPATEAARSEALLAAITPNPFLVAVSLGSDTGIVVYPDSTLEVFGNGEVWLMDGAATSTADLGQFTDAAALAEQGIQMYRLLTGHTFSFDQRTVTPRPASDTPGPVLPPKSKSPF